MLSRMGCWNDGISAVTNTLILGGFTVQRLVNFPDILADIWPIVSYQLNLIQTLYRQLPTTFETKKMLENEPRNPPELSPALPPLSQPICTSFDFQDI